MSFSKFPIRESEAEMVEDFGNFAIYPNVDPSFQFDPSLNQYLNDPTIGGGSFDGEIFQEDFLASIASSNGFADLDLSFGQLPQTLPPTCTDPQLTVSEIFPPVETKTSKKRIPKENNIKLSGSVGVGQVHTPPRASSKIHLVHPLEETYRPRYKSDYFAQNGTIRKPRYVTDRKGNHFISLKVPTHVFGCIRIDWLTTPNDKGDRYSMPYRFQASNQKNQEPDQNPLYVPIEADSNGLMKLYLVLIKAKQDDLKHLQPLKPFQPFKQAFGLTIDTPAENVSNMMPKQLIQEFKLDRSQLAFTYCSLTQDGKSYIPEWNTMVISTVITELSPDTTPRNKVVACPNCSHSFQVAIAPNDEETTTTTTTMSTETLPTKRKRTVSTKVKKQRIIDEIIFPSS